MRFLPTATASTAACVFGAVLVSILSPVSSRSERCFPSKAGFKDVWPFDESAGDFPKSVDNVDPVFELYSAGNGVPYELDHKNLNITLDQRKFNPKFATKFIIHGFGNALNKSVWITDMRKAFQVNGDYNIILVGWDTAFPHYIQAVCNSRIVARLTVSVIEMLQENGLDLSDLHLIGHSLGAHVSSYVGRMMDSNISRITGLDPAGPWFDTFGTEAKLDPSDARFVDVIHSNGHLLNFYGGFGLLEQSGHVDFYPNGGQKQPGCSDGVGGGTETFVDKFFQGTMDDMEESVLSAVGCSHGRAYEIFIESIKGGPCRFKSYPCPNLAEFERGICTWCGINGCNYAGLHANPHASGGKQFLQTSNKKPLCGHSVLVAITPAERANALEGSITMFIQGSSGSDAVTLNSGGPIHMWQGIRWKAVVSVTTDLGDMEYATLLYKRQGLFSRRRLRVSKLTIENMNNNRRYSTISEFRIRNEKHVKLMLKEE